jgi:hypothetical protein
MEADMAALLAAIAVSQRQPLKAEVVETIVVYSIVATEACTKNAPLLSWTRE